MADEFSVMVANVDNTNTAISNGVNEEKNRVNISINLSNIIGNKCELFLSF
jgi:hypothetical protein